MTTAFSKPTGPEMRAVTLKGLIELSSYLGSDGYALLREAKLHPQSLEDPEKRIPARTLIQVLQRAAEQTGCSTFGLQMAARRSFEDLGPISLLMQHLSNVLDVIETSISLRRHYNDLLLADVQSGGGQSFIRWDLQTDEVAWQACDLGLGLAYHLFEGASGGRWEPTKVHVAHAAEGDLSIWHKTFRCPIEFNSPINGFSCSTLSLETALPRANEVMAKHAYELLKIVEPSEIGKAYKEQVSRLLRLMIPKSKASLKEVSKHLEMKPRTLQRYLAREGCNFESLLEDEKMSYVFRILSNSSFSLGLISETLGYSSPSAFTRWFSKKTGMSPSVWRRNRAGVVQLLSPPTWRP